MDRPAPLAASYVKDPDAIYRASFAAIRDTAPIDSLPPDVQPLALRLIHASGMPDLLGDLTYTDDAVRAGHDALAAGKPILVDATMVAAGITKRYLPAGNEVVCTLNHAETPARAKAMSTTRSAAAVDLWRPHLEGAVVAIGNAPTALFRLLELLEDGAPRPALILGFPVGFVGAAESKEALIERGGDVPYVALRGRRGGSAMAAAAVNALAIDRAKTGAPR
ncbi:MAG: precorrin-8X methylmutase [Alphaproteobacteria bacterium]|nr:precorrin-8X methylmutase [Alphaproteobacteria bacterium]